MSCMVYDMHKMSKKPNKYLYDLCVLWYFSKMLTL